jgi:hypothetical protein
VFVIIVVIEAEVTDTVLVEFLAMLKAKSANDTMVRRVVCVIQGGNLGRCLTQAQVDGSLQGSHHGGKDNE